MLKKKYYWTGTESDQELIELMMSIDAYLGCAGFSPGKMATSPRALYSAVEHIYGLSVNRDVSLASNLRIIQAHISSMRRCERRRRQRAGREEIVPAIMAGEIKIDQEYEPVLPPTENVQRKRPIKGGGYKPTRAEKAEFYSSWEWRTLCVLWGYPK